MKKTRKKAPKRPKQTSAERLASDYDALKPEDFDVGALNPGARDPAAAAEKKQEYSRRMGAFARDLGGDRLDAKDGAYVAGLAEQERRFQNRRVARTVSLTAANEALTLRHFKAAAAQYLSSKIVPTGYAKKGGGKPIKRTVVLFLSDLHIGAELSALDNPVPYRATQEARRLEYVVRQAVDYKPQYREHSELLLLLGGDMIEGLLLHDLRDGAPLTEQMIRFWRYFGAALGLFAQTFPRVRVRCTPGNHGRNKLRHPGRATSSKWDGIEFQLYYALAMMAQSLPNVSFDLDFPAISIIDLYGAKLAMTHSDTEIKISHPDRAGEKNATELAKVNASRQYGVEFDAVAVGHWHSPRYQPGRPKMIFNGMLVPPNGHARSSGHVLEQCGQWVWEAVPGYPVGDLRFVEVGKSQDEDTQLGSIIKPFSLDA